MQKKIFIGILIGLSIFLAACGSNITPESPSSSKPVNITINTSPSPVMMGDVEMFFLITDAERNPIENAKVDVSADHTDMTGMTMNGLATDQGGGKYALKANFSMSGNWKLTIYVRKDGLDYKEDINFPVQ